MSEPSEWTDWVSTQVDSDPEAPEPTIEGSLSVLGALNALTGQTFDNETAAANAYAETEGLTLAGALNVAAGTQGRTEAAAANILAGTEGRTLAAALNTLLED